MSISINQKLSFNTLPDELLVEITVQVNEVTGSRGIRNEADIPVIMRNVVNLSFTCKSFAKRFLLELSSKITISTQIKMVIY